MNKPMSRADLDAVTGAMSFADLILQPRRNAETSPGAPFSKRPEGRARRMERRQAIARKREWIDS